MRMIKALIDLEVTSLALLALAAVIRPVAPLAQTRTTCG